MPQLLAAVACAAALIQGGYFPAFYLWAGAVLALGLLVGGGRVRVPRRLLALPGLAVWYLVAVLVNGPSVEGLAQGALPLVCTLYALLLLGCTQAERRRVLVWVCRFAGGASVAAILAFFGVLPLAGAVTAHRLQFTFQYVNAFAIWLAAAALLRWELEDKWVSRGYPFVLIALLLTRSIGAIGLFLVLQLAALLAKGCKGGGWRLWVPVGGLTALGLAAVATRLTQGLGTFQERLVQSYDGIKGILAAPVFGFGPGNWGAVKPLFQSYAYRAEVVHNSYVQAGVDAGLPALLLLLAAVVLALLAVRGQSPGWKAAAVLLPLHGVLDFTLCFFAIDCLMLAVLAVPISPVGDKPPRWATVVLGGLTFVFFTALAVLRTMG